MSIFHPHFVICIFPSAFYHPLFSIRILPSALFHPQFSICIFLSVIRHPPSAAIRSALYRDPIFSALFSRNNFSTRRGHFKELQVKGNLFDCSQILTVAGFTYKPGAIYKQQKRVSEFFISKYFFSRAIFVRSIHIFLILFQKKNFSLRLNMANRRHVFLALWPRKRRNTLNKRKTKFALTGNAQKVIWALAFRSREKFEN